MRPASPFDVLQKVWIALLLTWAAGFVDLVGYITLYQIYVAHMSGNTVALARHLSRMQWAGCARRGWPILTFIFGLLLGVVVADAEERKILRAPFPAIIMLELLLIGIFLWQGSGHNFMPVIPRQPAGKFFLMVALLTVAMGMQNVAVRKVGGLNAYTTFVTGSLVKFAESFSAYLFWLRERVLRRKSRRRLRRVLAASLRQPSLRRAGLTFSLWLVYLAGGVAGAVLTDRINLLSLTLPMGVLALVTIYGSLRPLEYAAGEEW
ncbi:MAG: YoaK family protein [Candidatus Binataceae bacterium]